MDNNKANQDREKAYQDMIKGVDVSNTGDQTVYLNEVAMGVAKPVKVQK